MAGVPLLVRVPDEIGPALLKRAIADGVSVQTVMLTALAHYLGVDTPIRKRGGQSSDVATIKPRRKQRS